MFEVDDVVSALERVIGAHTKTLLLENDELEKLLSAHKQQLEPAAEDAPAAPAKVAATAAPVLDISKLNPGDVIEGRYKYIEKIGKGAFGTVLLMHDEVVDEDPRHRVSRQIEFRVISLLEAQLLAVDDQRP